MQARQQKPPTTAISISSLLLRRSGAHRAAQGRLRTTTGEVRGGYTAPSAGSAHGLTPSLQDRATEPGAGRLLETGIVTPSTQLELERLVYWFLYENAIALSRRVSVFFPGVDRRLGQDFMV